MYPRVKRVQRGEHTYEYLQLVEGRREGGKVRQRVVATLGRVDELKASGQLDRWAGSFARLDPPEVGTRREVGPLLLVHHVLGRLGVASVIDAVAPMRGRALLTHGEVVCALVANRLCAPSPLYDVSGWASSAAMAELFDVPAALLNDDRLGRALEALTPVAEEVRGQLCLQALRRFPVADATRLHVDLSTVRFAGAYEDSSMVAKGWGSDRKIARQVRTLQASTPDGIALYFRPHKGSTAEITAMTAALEHLRDQLGPGLVVVADSALGHWGNLCAADRAGLRFVVPLRADTGWADTFTDTVPGGLDALTDIDYVSSRERRLPPENRTRWRGMLVEETVTDPATDAKHDMRVAYIWSSEEAASVAEARERALTKAEEQLGRIRNGLGGRYYRTQAAVDTRVAKTIGDNIAAFITVTTGTDPDTAKPTIDWHRNTDTIAHAARYDGLYALATNLADPADVGDVLRTYKDQWIVEQRHRDLKQTLRVRPVFLHNDDRIEALITIIGIALLAFGLIEAEIRHHLGADTMPGLLPEGRAAKPTGRNILAAFAHLGLTYTPTGPTLDHLTPTQRHILALLNIPLPWPETP
jgi:hypothetical protein